jgi:hypothetical protein
MVQSRAIYSVAEKAMKQFCRLFKHTQDYVFLLIRIIHAIASIDKIIDTKWV